MKPYSVITFGQEIDTDGKTWLEGDTMCGHTIAVANLRPNYYEVQVSGPKDNRHYSGGEGSEAHKTYIEFMQGYEIARRFGRKL